MTAATKNSGQPRLLCEHLERADEDMGDEGSEHGRDAGDPCART